MTHEIELPTLLSVYLSSNLPQADAQKLVDTIAASNEVFRDPATGVTMQANDAGWVFWIVAKDAPTI